MMSKSKFTQYSAAIVTAVAIFGASSANAAFTRSCNYTVNGTVSAYGSNGGYGSGPGGGPTYWQDFSYSKSGSTSASAATKDNARRKARDKIVSEQSALFQQFINSKKYVFANMYTNGASGSATIKITGDTGCPLTKNITGY